MESTMTPTTETQEAIWRWLASSLREPDQAYHEWADGRLAILRTGVLYDAVRMPEELVHAAVGSTVPGVVSGVLAEVLGGPVVCEPGRWYFALVPPGTCEVWRSGVSVVRGRGGWLGIPGVDRTVPSAVVPYWAVPVEQVGGLCPAAAVSELLRVGRERCEGTAGAVHSVAYVALLEHTEECTACAMETSPCAVGARLRTAERWARW
jgi:hypothetical protein